MQTRIVTVELEHDISILAEVTDLHDEFDVAGRSFQMDDVLPQIKALAAKLATSFEAVGARSCKAEFGLRLSADTGRLTGLLVSAKSDASLTVTLEWGLRD